MAVLLLGACGKKSETTVQLPEGMPDLQAYFGKEAQRLNKSQPGMQKTIQTGEDVESKESDSADWKAEFEPFLQWNPALARYQGMFEKAVDSGNGIVITRFTAKDTLCDIQEIGTTSKNGRLELIEIRTRERSWVADRDALLSYQPGRGYRILVDEDYIWSAKKRTEIFATLKNAEF